MTVREKSLTVKHREYELYYNEEVAVWRCDDLDMDANQLGALRKKVDKWLSDERRIEDGFTVFRRNWNGDFFPATVTRLDSAQNTCWISYVLEGRERRTKVQISELFLWSEVNMALVARLDDLRRQIAHLRREVTEAEGKFVPLTRADLMAALSRNPEA